VFGPTAVGKSELLNSLLDARFELISADSMQAYRHMDVGTAKPSREERARFPHHLVDVAEPSEQFTAGRFVKEAENLIPEVHRRGRVAVVSGGTAFYITSLLYGMPEAPPADAAIREKLRGMERDEGSAALYRALVQSDPHGAARIQPNDRYRVMRALEVFQATGRSLFSFRWPRVARQDMRFLLIGLDRPRDELYRRIDRRVDAMFGSGLIAEVASLMARGYGSRDPGMRGIGYRELLEMRGGCETLSEVRERIARATRRYAKRQLTFFRAVAEVSWMNPDFQDAVNAKVEAFVRQSACERDAGQST
jgi:tRNA dimethylallyltransferase